MTFRIPNSTRPSCAGLLTALVLFACFQSSLGQVPALPDAAVMPSLGAEFRTESIPVPGGAELITIFAKQSNFRADGASTSELPLVSVLRDTLGDDRAENDKLRFVWMLTYTRPTFWQKAASVVPFLYTRTGNKTKVGISPPPPIADLQGSDKSVWNSLLWLAFRKVLLSGSGFVSRATASQYRQNSGDYRRSAIAGALTVLSVYQKAGGESVLSEQEIRDIQAKLWLADKPLGGMLQDDNLDRMYEKKSAAVEDNRGHNWELLRQSAEAQGLYFEPIEMADGSATHAIVWASVEDLRNNEGRKFDGRFLNIKNPWTDRGLRNWTGYTRKVQVGDGERTMIPLAVYGLDTAKIPGILIDFRNNRNAKRREMSRRVINDITGNVLSVSGLGLPVMLGHTVLDFVTGRRGTDINQAARIRSYSQLKMLLALDQSLDPTFRNELASRIEDVSLNPLQNDLDVEANIARTQYRNLVDYARRPDGLAAKLERDRREEMVKYNHSGRERALYGIGHALSFGFYTHREEASADNLAELDIRRQLQFHERVINEIARRSVQPEVDSDIAQLRRSVLFVSERGSAAGSKTAKGVAKIFSLTSDQEMRKLCLSALYRIDNSAAAAELLAIYRDPKVATEYRELSAQFLRQSAADGKRLSSRTAAGVAALSAN